MDSKVLFMILDDDVLYLENSDMDHKEWYTSLNRDPNYYEQVIRGFIIDNKIVFFKGFFEYDNSVIRCARMFGTKIREHVKENYPVYCGILPNGAGGKWEPIMKISEDELNTPIVEKKEEPKVVSNKPTRPLFEFKNSYLSDSFIKIAIPVTIGVLILSLICMIFQLQKPISHTMDIILMIIFSILLIATCIGYYLKKPFTKFIAIASPVVMIFTFNLPCIIISVLYGLFTIDQGYFVKLIQFIRKVFKKNN